MVVSDNNSYRIVEALGILRKIFIYKEKENFFKNALRLKKELKADKHEVVYAMYPNGRRENILSFYLSKENKGGIKDRQGYWKMFCFLLRQTLALDKDGHDIINNLKLVGAPEFYQDSKPLIVVPLKIAEEVANSYFPNTDNRFTLILHPFSSKKQGLWNIYNYIYICQRLAREKKIRIVVAGSPDESELMDIITKKVGEGIEKYTKSNILCAAAFINHSDLFLGSDSSLMHISAALGKPTIAIWGFTDYQRTSPYGENSLIIRKDIDCSPCYDFVYGLRKNCQFNRACLNKLDKEIVYKIISTVIDEIKEKKTMQAIQLNSIENIKNITTLWSGCRMITIN